MDGGGKILKLAGEKLDFSVSDSEVGNENAATNQLEVLDAFQDNDFEKNSKFEAEYLQSKINKIIAEQ